MEAHCAQKSAVLSYSGCMAFLCFLFYLWVRSLDGQNVSCLFIMHLYLCVFWSTFMFRCPYNTYQRRRPLTEKNSRLLIFMQIADWMFVWGTEKVVTCLFPSIHGIELSVRWADVVHMKYYQYCVLNSMAFTAEAKPQKYETYWLTP